MGQDDVKVTGTVWQCRQGVSSSLPGSRSDRNCIPGLSGSCAAASRVLHETASWKIVTSGRWSVVGDDSEAPSHIGRVVEP